MRVTRLLPVILWLGYGCISVGTASVSDSASTRVRKAPTPEPLEGDLGFAQLVDLDLIAAATDADQDVRKGDVHDVYLADVVLTATKPDGSDLAFLDRLELYASAPGLPTILIATQDDFPPGITEVAFDLEDVDLKDYALSNALTITTQASGQTPDLSTTLEVGFTVDVGVTASGACRSL